MTRHTFPLSDIPRATRRIRRRFDWNGWLIEHIAGVACVVLVAVVVLALLELW